MTRRFALAAKALPSVAFVAVAARGPWRRGDTILDEAEAARDGHLDGRLAATDPLPPSAARDPALRSTLGMNVSAPDLRRFGFQLTRMDLFGTEGSGAAQLTYADRDQRALTIYVRHSDGTVRFDIIRRGETHICVWQDDVVGAVIMAPVSAAEMLRIASSAYTSLNSVAASHAYTSDHIGRSPQRIRGQRVGTEDVRRVHAGHAIIARRR